MEGQYEKHCVTAHLKDRVCDLGRYSGIPRTIPCSPISTTFQCAHSCLPRYVDLQESQVQQSYRSSYFLYKQQSYFTVLDYSFIILCIAIFIIEFANEHTIIYNAHMHLCNTRRLWVKLKVVCLTAIYIVVDD